MAGKFEAMWQDAADRFLRETGKSIRQNPPVTLQECTATIERSQHLSDTHEPEEQSKTERAKGAGLAIIQCLNAFGGIATLAAQMTFPASSMCFNAISFLLDVPQEIHDFHVAVNGLFEALGPTLSQFKMYDKMEQFDNLDSELLRAINEMMICFVDICRLSITLRGSSSFRAKLKIKSKLILLKDDSGVQSELSRLKSLSETHSQIQGTQILELALNSNSQLKGLLDRADRTYKVVSETYAHVSSLKDSDDKRKREESRKVRLKTIQDRLAISERERDSNRLYDKLRSLSVSEMGDWILQHPEFSKWADHPGGQGGTVLFLAGDAKTGKSSLAATIVHHLKQKSQSRTGIGRSLIGSYFFSTDTSHKRDDEETKPLHTALKAIAYQLAEQDSAFSGALSQACSREDVSDRFLKTAPYSELWDFLGIGSPKGQATHYLILDGLADMGSNTKGAVEDLMGLTLRLDQSKSSVRMLITARSEALQGPADLQNLRIDVEKHNQGDLRRYIDSKLKKSEMFQELDNESTRIRREIREKLSKKAKGNYYKIDTALDSIWKTVENDGTEQDIEKILETSGGDQDEMLQAKINELQRTLSAQDIRELNELLMWIASSKISWPFSIDELKAAMFLRFHKHSIQPLKKKITTKYGKLLEVSDQELVTIVDGMEALLIKPRTEPRNMDDTPKFSATITINKGDRQSVQSFLWKLLEKMNTLDLVHEDGELQNMVKETIHVNEFDAHLAVVRRILRLISEDPDEKTEALCPYAWAYLPDHLEELYKLEMGAGPDKLTSSEKREIGDGLYGLFVNVKTIEKHWANCSWVGWYSNKDELDTFMKWLSDESVTGHLGWRDREWLKNVRTHTNPPCLLLLDIMKVLARHWLQEKTYEVRHLFWWLRSYVNMVGLHHNNKDPKKDNLDDTSRKDTDEEVTVAMVENWCKAEVFGETVPDSLWHRRLGDTYYEREEYDRAIESYRRATDLDNKSILCFQGLANSLAKVENDLENIQKAVIELSKAAELAEKEEPRHEENLVDIYLQLVEWHFQLHQSQPAVSYTDKVLTLKPGQPDIQFKILRIFLLKGYSESATKLWCQLTKGSNGRQEPGSLDPILRKLVAEEETDRLFMRWLAFISVDTENFLFLLSELGLAIDRAEEEENLQLKAALLLYEGIAIHYFKDASSLANTDLDSWNQCLKAVPGDTQYWAKSSASRLISAYHFDRAREEMDSPSKEKHIRILRELARKDSAFYLSAAKGYLASFHTTSNASDQALMVYRGSMSSALDMLSDDEIANDWQAYYTLGTILVNCGDDFNSVSAFSHALCEPPGTNWVEWALDFDWEPARSSSLSVLAAAKANSSRAHSFEQVSIALEQVKSRLESLSKDNTNTDSEAAKKGLEAIQARLRMMEMGTGWFSCDGDCGRRWNFENPMYACKYCNDTAFCIECLSKLKSGQTEMFTLGSLVCNKTHDWLCLPKREKQEWLECLDGNVRVGGSLENGVRVGGELVSVSKWVESLKDKWGYSSTSSNGTVL